PGALRQPARRCRAWHRLPRHARSVGRASARPSLAPPPLTRIVASDQGRDHTGMVGSCLAHVDDVTAWRPTMKILTPEQSPLFTPWRDPISKVESLIFSAPIAPVHKSFYFTHSSFSAD